MKRSTVLIAGVTVLAASAGLMLSHSDVPDNPVPAPSPSASVSPEPEPARPSPVASTADDTAGHAIDYVQRDRTEGFAKWVVTANNLDLPGLMNSDPTTRPRLAATQREEAPALLAYEKAVDRFPERRSQLTVIRECGIRSDDWVNQFDDRLRVEEAKDPEVQTLRKVLTKEQKDTVDAYYHYVVVSMLNFNRMDCGELSAMPFMAKYDRYVRGEIPTLD